VLWWLEFHHFASLLSKFHLRPHLLKAIVYVIRLITNRKYAFCCILLVRLSPDNISLVYWITIDHVLLWMIMIDSFGTVHNYASVARLFFPTDSLYFNCPLLYISRLFSTGRSCGSCGRTIGAGELVMKAGNAAYHVKCFTCATCRQQLMTGDRYSIVNGAILCEQDSAQESKGQW